MKSNFLKEKDFQQEITLYALKRFKETKNERFKENARESYKLVLLWDKKIKKLSY